MGSYDSMLELLSDEMLEVIARKDLDPNFLEIIPSLKSVRADLQSLESQGEIVIPQARTNSIEQAVSHIRTYVDKAIAFKPMELNNPQGERQNIVTNIRQMSDQVVENLRPFLRPDFSSIEIMRRQAESLHNDLKLQILDVNSTVTEARKLLDDAAASLAEIKSSAVKKAADRTSEYYFQATETHRRAALGYLIAASILGLILSGLVVAVFYANPPNIPTNNWAPVLIREALGRILVLLIVVAAIAFCTKNYRVNKHLQTINQTRFNALETAGLYVAGVTSDDARNIVVSELVRAIFTPGDTGYMSTDREQTIIENPGSLIGILGATGKK